MTFTLKLERGEYAKVQVGDDLQIVLQEAQPDGYLRFVWRSFDSNGNQLRDLAMFRASSDAYAALPTIAQLAVAFNPQHARVSGEGT